MKHYIYFIDYADFMKMCVFKKLAANRVNSWHTCYLDVLRGAELLSAACPAQKWL